MHRLRSQDVSRGVAGKRAEAERERQGATDAEAASRQHRSREN